jgi:sphinganine C4-monooxygenase
MDNATMHTFSYTPHFPSPLPPAYLPLYHVSRSDLLPSLMSDKVLFVVAPVVAYWSFSLFWTFIDWLQWDCFERYRIHEPEEIKSKNKVTVREVLVAVFVQHALQTIAGYLWMVGDEEVMDYAGELNRWGARLAKVVVPVAGTKTGGAALAKYGQEATRLLYFYGLPAVKLSWAMCVLSFLFLSFSSLKLTPSPAGSLWTAGST